MIVLAVVCFDNLLLSTFQLIQFQL